MAKSQTRPLFDATGRVIDRISPTAMKHNGQLVIECDAGHLYAGDALSVKRGHAPACPVCPELVDDETDEAV